MRDLGKGGKNYIPRGLALFHINTTHTDNSQSCIISLLINSILNANSVTVVTSQSQRQTTNNYHNLNWYSTVSALQFLVLNWGKTEKCRTLCSCADYIKKSDNQSEIVLYTRVFLFCIFNSFKHWCSLFSLKYIVLRLQ